jgi:hypothetical protein
MGWYVMVLAADLPKAQRNCDSKEGQTSVR